MEKYILIAEMFDVVSIGNATLDVFIEVSAKKRRGCLALPCGSKQEVKSIFYSTGGGATNTAVAFARLGLKAGILAAIGSDDSGKRVLDELKMEKVHTGLVVRLKGFSTAYSAVVTGKGFDRIIFTYGGATTHLRKESLVNWKLLGESRWFYVSSFHSKPALLKKVFAFAEKKGISVAWNPGRSELKQGLNKLKPLLAKTGILFLNEEEASLLVGKKSLGKCMKALAALAAVVVVTQGKKGALAFDGTLFHRQKARKLRVVDSTGAGDAFNAGFTAAIIRGKSVGSALKLGSKEAESVLAALGAKNNLLKRKL